MEIARANDALSIVQIGEVSFTHAFEHLFEKKQDLKEYLSYTYEEQKMRSSIEKPNNIFFIASNNRKPVGFAKVKRSSINKNIDAHQQMELQKIYVLPEYHGAGAGTSLINAVLNAAKEVKPDVLWLDVHISNVKAISFYEKTGFVKTAKHFFQIGSQVFEYHVMSLPINTK